MTASFVGLLQKQGETPQTARERILQELDAETITILRQVDQTLEGHGVIEELAQRWLECGVLPPWSGLL